MQLILISGLSGSGKTVALRALEDCGYYCVDNLPATMLSDTLQHYAEFGYARIAISVDTRSSPSLGALPEEMQRLRQQKIEVNLIFLTSQDDILVKRFSETRRRHPLAGLTLTVQECIRLERDMLVPIQALGTLIDTSNLTPNHLRQYLHGLIEMDAGRLTLVFQSFGFKHGLPMDADFVFDVRCLPNPYYHTALRPLTGNDPAVVDFFVKEPSVHNMINDIHSIIAKWLPYFNKESRSYLTVAVGCTGGQHRSVYIVETLAAHFRKHQQVLVRHRQLA